MFLTPPRCRNSTPLDIIVYCVRKARVFLELIRFATQKPICTNLVEIKIKIYKSLELWSDLKWGLQSTNSVLHNKRSQSFRIPLTSSSHLFRCFRCSLSILLIWILSWEKNEKKAKQKMPRKTLTLFKLSGEWEHDGKKKQLN